MNLSNLYHSTNNHTHTKSMYFVMIFGLCLHTCPSIFNTNQVVNLHSGNDVIEFARMRKLTHIMLRRRHASFWLGCPGASQTRIEVLPNFYKLRSRIIMSKARCFAHKTGKKKVCQIFLRGASRKAKHTSARHENTSISHFQQHFDRSDFKGNLECCFYRSIIQPIEIRPRSSARHENTSISRLCSDLPCKIDCIGIFTYIAFYP